MSAHPTKRSRLAVETVRARLAARRIPHTERTWLEVAEEAALAEGVVLVAVLSYRRTPGIVRARRRAWRELRDAKFSSTEIAEAWGRDPTTVLYGARRAA